MTPISVRYPEPNDNGAIRHLTLCRIEADDGTVGWGEAVTSWPDACRATEAMIEGIGAELVVGRDPLDNVELWRACRQRAWWYGNRGGISSFALSAIDIALWDLKGRLLGVPVTQLLGGARHESIPAIASTHPRDASLEVEADRHARYVNELGFKGCKLGLGKRGDARLGSEVERDVELIRLLRERIGPEPMLMWDRGVNTLTWDAAFAIRLTNALEEHGLTWIEEPFEPEDHDDFRRLKARSLDAPRLRRARVERRGLPQLHRGGRRRRDRLRPRPGRGDHRRPAGDRARRGGRRLVQRARLVERDRDGGEPRALADDPARARLRAEGGGEPDAARARGGADRRRSGLVAPLPGPGLGIEVREDVVERYRF